MPRTILGLEQRIERLNETIGELKAEVAKWKEKNYNLDEALDNATDKNTELKDQLDVLPRIKAREIRISVPRGESVSECIGKVNLECEELSID